MESKIKLSIIVPVYNVEDWLPRCLISLLKQDIKNCHYEVIIVNDGSTDKSKSIAETFAALHNNVHLFNKPNGGLSDARNYGLSKANGKYIWFVDSDDWIEENVLGQLIETAINNNLDVLCFGLKLRYEDGSSKEYPIADRSKGIVSTGVSFIQNVDMPPAAWCAIYKKEFLFNNNLFFMTGILHEDQEFTPRAYLLSSRICYFPQHIYNYFQRDGSIMKSDNSKRKTIDLIKIADSLYNFLNKQNLDPAAKGWLLDRIAFIVGQSLTHSIKAGIDMSSIKMKPYMPLKYRNENHWSIKFKYQLINISPAAYVRTYRIISEIKNIIHL